MITSSGGLPQREHLRRQITPSLGREVETSLAEAGGGRGLEVHSGTASTHPTGPPNPASFTHTSAHVTSTRNPGCVLREGPGQGLQGPRAWREVGEAPVYMTTQRDTNRGTPSVQTHHQGHIVTPINASAPLHNTQR